MRRQWQALGRPGKLKRCFSSLSDAYKLLEVKEVDKGWWFQAEDCLWGLSRTPTSEAVDGSLLLLDRLVSERKREDCPQSTLLMNNALINAVLINWHAVSRQFLDADPPLHKNLVTPQKLFAMMTTWSQEIKPVSLLTAKSLSYIIDLLGRSDPPDPEFAEERYRQMGQFRFAPSVTNLNAVLSLYRRTGNAQAMSHLIQYAKDNNYATDAASHNLILTLYADRGWGKQAEEYIKQQKITPTVETWNIVLNAWARSTDKSRAARRADQLLAGMMMYGNTEESQLVPPNLLSFNTTLKALAQAGKSDTCEQLLSEMETLYHQDVLDTAPDYVSYATVIHSFARASRPEEAEDMANRVYAEFMSGRDDMRPDRVIFTCVLDAYYRKMREETDVERTFYLLERARGVLDRMSELNSIGIVVDEPDTACYNVMLMIYWLGSKIATVPRRNTSAEQALRLLQEMRGNPPEGEPDFRSFCVVIQSLLNRPDGFREALRLLDEILPASPERLPISIDDASSVLYLVQACCERNRPDLGQLILMRIFRYLEAGADTIDPGMGSLGCLMRGWKDSDRSDAAEMSTTILQTAEGMYERGIIEERPDFRVYDSLIHVLVKANQPLQAHGVFQKLRKYVEQGDTDMQPYPRLYGRVAAALAKGGLAEQTEMVLHDLYTDWKAGKTEHPPSAYVINNVLKAYSVQKSTSRRRHVEKLVFDLHRIHESGEFVCFDSTSYGVVLRILGGSNRRESAILAESMLNRWLDDFKGKRSTSPPTAGSFALVINAWIRSKEPEQALRILRQSCRSFREGVTNRPPHNYDFENITNSLMRNEKTDPTDQLQEVELLRKEFLSEIDLDDAPPLENRNVGTVVSASNSGG